MARQKFTKVQGCWDVCRKLSVPNLRSEEHVKLITGALHSTPGICQVLVYASEHKIHVMYDQAITNFQSIQAVLKKLGFPISDSWWSQKMANWYQYLDKNAHHNATTPVVQTSCCSVNERVSSDSKCSDKK